MNSGKRIVALVLLAASAATSSCAIIAQREDPVHAARLAQLEQRMNRVESHLPPPPPPPPPPE